MKRVLVAMSGGVDSSAAAMLLKRSGWEVEGITMSFTFSEEGSKQCFSPLAVTDAAKVCASLDIPHHVVEAGSVLEKAVIGDFIEEYKRGRTPNPCVRCNQHLKFGLLYEAMKQHSCDFLATGHYASISHDEGGAHLEEAKDRGKDQTYFLWGIEKRVLPHIIFPVADLQKKDLRVIAEEAGLSTAQKKDSQDICFVPDGNYRDLLERYGIKSRPGDIVTKDGRVLGKHRGIEHYTIGQRRGVGVALGVPAFVTAINRSKNVVVVGPREDVMHSGCTLKEFNQLEPLEGDLSVKIRSTMGAVPATVINRGDSIEIIFNEKQFAVSQGQSAVIYSANRVVGGGIIEAPIP